MTYKNKVLLQKENLIWDFLLDLFDLVFRFLSTVKANVIRNVKPYYIATKDFLRNLWNGRLVDAYIPLNDA